MKHYVYVLISTKNYKIRSYVGYTNDLKKRLLLHNTGKGAKSTRGYKWKLIYSKIYKSKSRAMSAEYYLKINRNKRKNIINLYLSTN